MPPDYPVWRNVYLAIGEATCEASKRNPVTLTRYESPAQLLKLSHQMLIVKPNWWCVSIFSTPPLDESIKASPPPHLHSEEATSIHRPVKSRFCTVMWPQPGQIGLDFMNTASVSFSWKVIPALIVYASVFLLSSSLSATNGERVILNQWHGSCSNSNQSSVMKVWTRNPTTGSLNTALPPSLILILCELVLILVCRSQRVYVPAFLDCDSIAVWRYTKKMEKRV